MKSTFNVISDGSSLLDEHRNDAWLIDSESEWLKCKKGCFKIRPPNSSLEVQHTVSAAVILPVSAAAVDTSAEKFWVPVPPQTRVLELAEQVISTSNGERLSAGAIKSRLYFAGHADAVFCFDGTRIGRDFQRPLQQHSWKFANSQSLSVDEVWLTQQ